MDIHNRVRVIAVGKREEVNTLEHIDLGTVVTLWETMDERSWFGLRQALSEFYYENDEELSGITCHTIDNVIAMARLFAYQKQAFPQSAYELYQVMVMQGDYREQLRHGL